MQDKARRRAEEYKEIERKRVLPVYTDISYKYFCRSESDAIGIIYI